MGCRNRPKGVAVTAFLKHPGVGVRLTCRACGLEKVAPLEPVVRRLRARRLDPDQIGIAQLADFVKGRCDRCAGERFDTRPSWEGT